MVLYRPFTKPCQSKCIKYYGVYALLDLDGAAWCHRKVDFWKCSLGDSVPSHSDRKSSVNATATMHTELNTWGGGFHRVPREFVLPPRTVRVVWQQWCAGQPPLKQLSKHDMASRLQKIRLAELQRLMRFVEALLTSDEVLRAHSSLDSAGLLFEQVKNRLPFSSTSSKGRARRLDQLSWRTLAREQARHSSS